MYVLREREKERRKREREIIWRSEDQLWESIFSFRSVGSQESNLWQPALCLLSHLTGLNQAILLEQICASGLLKDPGVGKVNVKRKENMKYVLKKDSISECLLGIQATAEG